jgi:hypothetical protein
MLTSEATKRCENMHVRKALGERLSVGTDVDRFTQVKACAAWLSAAAEGDARVGAWWHERACQVFSPLIAIHILPSGDSLIWWNEPIHISSDW